LTVSTSRLLYLGLHSEFGIAEKIDFKWKAKIELAGLEDSLDLYKFEVEKAIASDDTLKNDNQRKAKRLELKSLS
jgi:hypothetical protein